jgi:hypothetical protein
VGASDNDSVELSTGWRQQWRPEPSLNGEVDNGATGIRQNVPIFTQFGRNVGSVSIQVAG